MKIKFYAPEWGNTLPFEIFAENVKEAGYDGVEMALPFDGREKDLILKCLEKFDLELIGQYWQSFEKDINLHLENFEKYLRNLADANPIFINSQTGKDYFSFDQNKQLFDLADRISKETNVKIVHETHRGKSLFAAHIAQEYLIKIPQIKLCLDISHWCNVHESLLEDQEEAVNLAILHTDHIHSRIGHEEGPQVTDPRLPQWSVALERHLKWWDLIVSRHKKDKTNLTITTEFGPSPYMVTVEPNQTPIADQWGINVYVLNLLKQRFLCNDV